MSAKEFRSLENVDLPLGPLTVLVGPNGSGKTNVLNVLRFLASTVRFDLAAAVDEWGGFDYVKRQGEGSPRAHVKLEIEGIVTNNASRTALDEYKLSFSLTARNRLRREESFTFKRTQGQGRRITIKGSKVEFSKDDPHDSSPLTRELADAQRTGLATLPDWSDEDGGEGIRLLADFLSRRLSFQN
ncbi:AAA family ATPase [Candidatus Poriferisodalis sp.]|uniref:AAA family ATPase n=1 Tax=Candidatus Poriferisodalis sp. TaxID=3101277 RepID=UPI003B018F6C